MLAVREFAIFDPAVEPIGWVRCVEAGKPTRRRPDGDPDKEFVAE